MKYCNNCGKSIPNKTKICPSCGAKIGKWSIIAQKTYNKYNTQQVNSNQQYELSDNFQTPHIPRKIPIISVLLFILILPGIGQIFAGKKRRGLVLMASTLILILIAVIVPLSTNFYQTIYILNPIITILLIWGIVDALIQIRKYNQFIDQQGLIPSPREK